jgi:uncharacterized caspase-like protein
VAGRYRALLIGNSTYPSDEHNLQALKGPVKDIAVLNRALADPASGLFADTDVTLLPEVTSARAIRAIGRFFGDAARDDVLLFYFSGHGKLDQAGRLHLCMQDTESTDLLSTAVSSARINEFADASHARNVVIVLDCCFSGAFRGGDLGDAVAGPGRYVMTSCRGTQLANDATAENSTSHFTQHLVNGLTGDAEDHDGDGYVTFSDLYAYVDRRLRETGKQIPQRRVQGDGDLPLARRQRPATAAGRTADEEAADDKAVSGLAREGTAEGGTSRGAPGPRAPAAGSGAYGARGQRGWPARRVVVLACAVVAAVAGGAVAWVLLSSNGSGGPSSGTSGGGSGYTSAAAFTATAPWRLKVNGAGNTADGGCDISVVNARTGTEVRHLSGGIESTSTFVISARGTFRWRVNDAKCVVVAQPGTTPVTLPFALNQYGLGDTGVFTAPAKVSVHATDYQGSQSCSFALFNPATGTELDFGTITKGQTAGDSLTLESGGSTSAYVETDGCGFHVSAAS